MGKTIITANLGDAISGGVTVSVDLLASLPTSLDPLTWVKMGFPGYLPAPAFLAPQVDRRPDGILFQCEPIFKLPDPPPALVAFGITWQGLGIAVGLVTERDGSPFISVPGLIFLTILVLLQNWVPQGP